MTPIPAVSPELKGIDGVYEIDPLQDSRWAEFVERDSRASVFHSPSWLRALRLTYGYEPSALCTAPPGAPVTGGLVFCRITSWLTGKRLVSLPFSDHCDPIVGSEEELDAILRRLRASIAGGYIELRPLAQTTGQRSGFEECQSYYWHAVDLSPGPDALLRSFHKDCVRRNIRRAERESLKCEVGNSEELLTRFYRLLVMSRRRHGLPPQPRSWFLHLGHTFGDKLQVRVASHNGLDVASILTLKQGTTVTYKYGGSDPRFKRLGGTALLFWRTILEAKSEGMRQFDLGRAEVDHTGLIRFKEHWGANRTLLKYRRFPGGVSSNRNRGTKSLLRRIASIVPNWSLITVGKLLYPHIG